MNFLRSLLKISRKTLVGKDHLGNKYFEAIQHDSSGMYATGELED